MSELPADYVRPESPNLGMATTRQLLAELAARFEIHGSATSVTASGMHELLGTLPMAVLDYRTVDSERHNDGSECAT